MRLTIDCDERGSRLSLKESEAIVWLRDIPQRFNEAAVANDGAVIAVGSGLGEDRVLVIAILGGGGALRALETYAQQKYSASVPPIPSARRILLWNKDRLCAIWMRGLLSKQLPEQLWLYRTESGWKASILEPQASIAGKVGVSWEDIRLIDVAVADGVGLLAIVADIVGGFSEKREGQPRPKLRTVLTLMDVNSRIVCGEIICSDCTVESIVKAEVADGVYCATLMIEDVDGVKKETAYRFRRTNSGDWERM